MLLRRRNAASGKRKHGLSSFVGQEPRDRNGIVDDEHG
jgi:hypothetical protein